VSSGEEDGGSRHRLLNGSGLNVRRRARKSTTALALQAGGRRFDPVTAHQWRSLHTYTRAIGLLDEIKRLLTGAKEDAEIHAEGGEPVATPPGEEERETSTNAQMMGSSDEPWSGNN
jgi:hypothetical protein